jgi:hypothetical protein
MVQDHEPTHRPFCELSQYVQIPTQPSSQRRKTQQADLVIVAETTLTIEVHHSL